MFPVREIRRVVIREALALQAEGHLEAALEAAQVAGRASWPARPTPRPSPSWTGSSPGC